MGLRLGLTRYGGSVPEMCQARIGGQRVLKGHANYLLDPRDSLQTRIRVRRTHQCEVCQVIRSLERGQPLVGDGESTEGQLLELREFGQGL